MPAGRPKLSNTIRLSRCLRFQVTEMEDTLIRLEAERSGTSPSRFLRDLVVTSIRDEEREDEHE